MVETQDRKRQVSAIKLTVLNTFSHQGSLLIHSLAQPTVLLFEGLLTNIKMDGLSVSMVVTYNACMPMLPMLLGKHAS